MLTPVILLGGILAGIMTPTEAAAVAAAYALCLGLAVHGTLRPADVPRVFAQAAVQSGVILMLVGAAVSFAWIVTVSGLADTVSATLAGASDNPLLLLLILNVFLLAAGMVLDAGPAILILGPVLGPVFTDMGVDPLHFAIVMCMNLTVGLATPPMGLVLFVAASVSGEPVERLARALLPFLAVEVSVILLVTYVPALSLTLPRLLGLA